MFLQMSLLQTVKRSKFSLLRSVMKNDSAEALPLPGIHSFVATRVFSARRLILRPVQRCALLCALLWVLLFVQLFPPFSAFADAQTPSPSTSENVSFRDVGAATANPTSPATPKFASENQSEIPNLPSSAQGAGTVNLGTGTVAQGAGTVNLGAGAAAQGDRAGVEQDEFYRIPTSFPASRASELPVLSKEGIPLYLLNQNGNLVAIPGVRLEFMDQALRSVRGSLQAEGLVPNLPDFVFHSILANGYVEKDVMRMRVSFIIETFDETPVSVPLKFNEAILLGTPSGRAVQGLADSPVPQSNQNAPTASTKTDVPQANAPSTDDAQAGSRRDQASSANQSQNPDGKSDSGTAPEQKNNAEKKTTPEESESTESSESTKSTEPIGNAAGNSQENNLLSAPSVAEERSAVSGILSTSDVARDVENPSTPVPQSMNPGHVSQAVASQTVDAEVANAEAADRDASSSQIRDENQPNVASDANVSVESAPRPETTDASVANQASENQRLENQTSVNQSPTSQAPESQTSVCQDPENQAPESQTTANFHNQDEKAQTHSEAFYASLAEKLTGAIPVEREYSGPGNVWVDFSSQNGFTAWITGKGVHEIELTFLAPFVRSPSGEAQFQIQFPYATTSELKIHIPQTRLESERLQVSMTGGATLHPPYFVSAKQEAVNQESASSEASDSETARRNENPDSGLELGQTCVSAIRLGGEFWITWSVSPQEKAATPDILDVESLILTGIGKDSVTYDARLKVTRKDSNVASFRVRLPRNATLQPQNTSEYSIVNIQENPDSDATLAEVTLKNPVSRQIRVDVHAKSPLPTESSSPEWFNLAGFEVLSAVRQSGYYAIKTTSGKHANWTPGAGMHRLEELPVPLELWTPVKNLDGVLPPGASAFSDDSQNEFASSPQTMLSREASETESNGENSPNQASDATFSRNGEFPEDFAVPPSFRTDGTENRDAPKNPYLSENADESADSDVWSSEGVAQNLWDSVFEFDSQPTPLWTRIVEKTTRVNIEPKYVVSVQEDKLLLEATWNCTIRGGKISWIDVDLNGWKFLSCSSESLIAVDRINDISPSNSESSVISMPFNQPMGNHVALTFKAERPIAGDSGIFQFELPRKFETEVARLVFANSPARLLVTAPPNLEIIPTRQCRRLVRQPLSDALKNQLQDGSTLLLYQCKSEKAFFEATLKIHERETRIKQLSSIELARREYRVSQKFEYSVSYEKLDSLHFLVPEMEIGALSISINGNDAQKESKFQRRLAMKPASRAQFSFAASHSSIPVISDENSSDIPREISSMKTGGTENVQPEGASTSTSPTAPDRSAEEAQEEPRLPIQSIPEERIPSIESPAIATPFPDGEKKTDLILKFRPSRIRRQFMEVEAILPEERLGTFTVSISYSLPMVKLEQEKAQLIDLLLATSEDGTTNENFAEVKTSENLEIISPERTDQESPWEECDTESAFSTFASPQNIFSGTDRRLLPGILCKSVCAQNSLQIQIKNHAVFTRDSTIVERCWLQTWLADAKRQDRAVFLFPREFSDDAFDSSGSSAGHFRTVRIHLPGKASADSAEIWINRKPVILGNEIKRLSGNILQISYPLPSDSQQAPTVEIRYQFDEPISENRFNALEIPYVEEAVWVRGIYWQLVLPPNLHLFQAPKGFSMEYRWGWRQCFAGRLPIWEQQTLERWAGAREGTPVPLKMNRYVLAGMGTNDSLNASGGLLLMNRTVLTMGLSLVVFGAGCLFLYFQILQKPISRLATCAILVGFAFRFPEFALLGSQAAVLGMLLLFASVMCGLRKKMHRKLYVSEPTEDQTICQSVPQTVITPSENSLHAFRTVTYEQSLGISDQNQSTVVRKS